MEIVNEVKFISTLGNFLAPIRTARGFPTNEYQKVREILKETQLNWKDSKLIPKVIAMAIIDLLVVVDSSRNSYDGIDRECLCRASDELYECVQQMLL